jgi:serine protease
MSHFTKVGLAALAVASLAACSDTLSPSREMAAPQELSLAKLSGTSDVEEVVPGEVLVKFKDGIDAEAKAKGKGLGLLKKGYADAFVILSTSRGNENAVANVLKNDADVEWAEPNYLRQPDTDARLWAFYNPGGLNMTFTSGGTGTIPASYASILDADEDAPSGTFAAGGAAVTVGSIDTGVQMNHVEFTGRLIAGKDWVNNDADPSDTEGHGTHTTGTIAGSTVGVAGTSGAASNVKVYVQRVCGPSGCPTSAIINAINAAASYIDANGKHLVAVNLSLGGTTESSGEKTAIQNATNQGVLVIASAGNSGSRRVACPACDPNAISVMATNWKDAKTSYSQYGSGLDIAAPGGECYSNTTPEGCIYSSYLSGTNNGYAWLQGTSMAAPQVTGAAAVVASKTGLRGSALRSRLLSTVDRPSSISQYNVGRLNIYRAVTNASLPAGQ